ncbi:hypothetical protein Pmani_010742 [Petrolisthes manimaculis]|uniref:Oplophorus-luciferin 2-monooxygenase non-catalytic subunit n=1 Tax=Petrolisthes manimaculis TaxID=1843537 RepID=A0AAE1Q1J9_9EUCA|nr:hypothetical protein Pmani_010742 [Petrolisthes manimaculis]
MVHQIFVLLAALSCCFCCGTLAIENKDQHLRDLPCPPAEDIQPCVCTVIDSSTYDIEMDCSSVTTNDELASIFSKDFPYNDFFSLVIDNNNHLTTIRPGDFGQKTFQQIHITSGSLQTVYNNAFSSSYDTLTEIDIENTNLDYFPFHELNLFPQLYHLHLENNHLLGSPVLTSSSLGYLYLNGNPIDGIILKTLPLLDSIYLRSTSITHLPPGTFTNLPNLDYMRLGYNGLQVLEAGTINLQTSFNNVDLYNNDLTSIAEGALVGLKGGYLDVRNNQLTELAEAVFRPLIDDGVDVYASGNPLDCGCEITWLVTSDTYMNLLDDDASCTSGQLVSELDPAMFDVIC